MKRCDLTAYSFKQRKPIEITTRRQLQALLQERRERGMNEDNLVMFQRHFEAMLSVHDLPKNI